MARSSGPPLRVLVGVPVGEQLPTDTVSKSISGGVGGALGAVRPGSFTPILSSGSLLGLLACGLATAGADTLAASRAAGTVTSEFLISGFGTPGAEAAALCSELPGAGLGAAALVKPGVVSFGLVNLDRKPPCLASLAVVVVVSDMDSGSESCLGAAGFTASCWRLATAGGCGAHPFRPGPLEFIP